MTIPVFFTPPRVADPRDLHSFPTRRSSDLAALRSAPKARIRYGWHGRAPSGRPPGNLRSADRKSTRLNSSHLVISYAFFCLKKKKVTVVPRVKSSPWYSPLTSTGTKLHYLS